MPKKDPAADILEWTIHDDLEPGEELPPLAGGQPPAAPRNPWRGRRPWLMLAVAAGLVALGPWLYQRWQWRQTESGLAEIVSLQDAAGPAPLAGLTAPEGDTPRLHALAKHGPDLAALLPPGRRDLAAGGGAPAGFPGRGQNRLRDTLESHLLRRRCGPDRGPAACLPRRCVGPRLPDHRL
jgi:hypothetical protein